MPTSRNNYLAIILLAIASPTNDPAHALDDGALRPLPESVAGRVADLEERIKHADQQAAAVAEELLNVRRQASDVDRRLQPLLGELEAIERLRRDADGKVEKQREAARKARAEQVEHQRAIEGLKKELEELQKKIEETAKKEQEAAEAAAKADAEVLRLRKELAERVPKIGPLTVATLEPTADKRLIDEQVVELERQLEQLQADRDGLNLAIETELKQAGEWVSFREQLAPILHRSCLPCHNARAARGGYALHTYENLMGEGDSGAAIVPADVDGSWLVDLVASGDMPIDADPLQSEEVELIRRWVALGARLDASAEPSTQLVQLMPRPTMPAPPETYPLAAPVSALATTGTAGDQVVASSGYREVLLWSAEGELLKRIDNMLERVYGLSFSPDGRLLAVASGTPGQLGDVSLYATGSGELLESLVLSADVMLDVQFSPDGERLAAAGADGKIYLFGIQLGVDAAGELESVAAERQLVIADHADWVNAIAWSSDGGRLASASRDKTAKVFDAASGKSLITFTEHEHNVVDIEFAKGDQELITADDGGRPLRVWRQQDGKRVRELKLPAGEVIALTRLGDEQLGVVLAGGELFSFDPREGKQLAKASTAADWPSSLTVDAEGAIWSGDQAGHIHRLSGLEQAATATRWLAVPASR